MTKLHFYKGLRTIGGTVVEVETESARCLFDFGIIYQNELDHQVNVRTASLVRDYLKLGILPEIPGIYEEMDIKELPLKAWSEDGKKVFFLISHMHIDHMEALGLLSQDIPVYMSEDSLKLYEGICETSEYFYRIKQNCMGIRKDIDYQVGEITFRAIAVDHDIPGACGYRITTGDGTISYTGDYRLHGLHPEDTLAFAKKVRGTDLLITEGVTASFMEGDLNDVASSKTVDGIYITEEQMIKTLYNEISNTNGAVFINLYNRDIDRMYELWKALKKTDKKMVFEPASAYFLNKFYNKENLFIYEPLARAKSLEQLHFTCDYQLIGREEITANPGGYVLQLSYKNLLELLDLPLAGSLFLHANGAPLGDYDPAYVKMLAFLNKQNIRFESMCLGGHAYPEHLKYILETVGAAYLIPLHSLNPEKVHVRTSQQILPQTGSNYVLENHQLREVPFENVHRQ